MKVVCLLPVRDEADIIGHSLTHLLNWADEIWVFDTGSVDSSWETVQQMSLQDRRIKPMRKEAVYFSETYLRGWMFHHARQGMTNGDWFLRVDADEFHHISPQEFIKTRLSRHETIVYHQYYNFCLLESEVRDWQAGKESLLDRQRSIEFRRHWYLPSLYSEPRLCKYRETMRWPPTVSFPYNAGYIAEQRLPIRHYPHRDPVQLERRCRLRAVMMADAENRSNWSRPELHHWSEQNWKQFITPDSTPNLKYWEPGSVLEEVSLKNHRSRLFSRLLKRTVHQFFLPLLDRTRREWPPGTSPQRIPADIIARLESELKL